MHLLSSPNIVPFSAATDTNGIFDQAAVLRVNDIHLCSDPGLGLKAIVAIHDTSRGPALGGTRCIRYASERQAIDDVMRLAQGMSYKSAFARLPYGGGKAVLIRPESVPDRTAYFERYAEFIESLNGRFVTAVDVGTDVSDMDTIARKTQYVMCTSAASGDPSNHTAHGVLNAILAAVCECFEQNDLASVRVAIQGLGKVGMRLAGLLHERGANLIVSDLDKNRIQQCVDEFGATSVSIHEIIAADCDVLAPCALGGVIDNQALTTIRAKIICGAANNQLAQDEHGDRLFSKNIFYVPDYVANAGGLIHISFGSSIETTERIQAIYDSVIDLFRRSRVTRNPSHRVANEIAKQRLIKSRQA